MNGSPAPLYDVSPGQIDFHVPWELAGKPTADVSVGVTGFSEKSVAVALAPGAPGIFTAGPPDGQAIAVIAGTSSFAAPVGALPGSRPVQRGEALTVYCNGLGPVADQPLTGSVGPSDGSATTNLTPVVTIGGASAKLIFSGLAPGLVGIYQVNLQVPQNASTGDAVSLVLSIGGASSNTATIAVQ
jgi:uncharacterized protein (TIGR03437 family)